MSTVAQLLEQKAALERQIADAQRAEKAGAIAEVRALMDKYGLSMADLSARGPAKPRAKAASKVAVKYRDPATGDTWTGRGLKPKWLRAHLDAGRKVTDFAV